MGTSPGPACPSGTIQSRVRTEEEHCERGSRGPLHVDAVPGDRGRKHSHEMDLDGVGHGGEVFVTVGTTSFDDLIQVVDTLECKAALVSRGYSSLVIQRGRGSYVPSKSTDGDCGALKVDHFTFAPDLKEYMRSASLIISHAGSGSIFEALHMGKPLVVVVNEALMDNHQAELAEELAACGYLLCASPGTLIETIGSMDRSAFARYEPSNPTAFVNSLNQYLGDYGL